VISETNKTQEDFAAQYRDMPDAATLQRAAGSGFSWLEESCDRCFTLCWPDFGVVVMGPLQTIGRFEW
jgi:hypothetical protein